MVDGKCTMFITYQAALSIDILFAALSGTSDEDFLRMESVKAR